VRADPSPAAPRHVRGQFGALPGQKTFSDPIPFPDEILPPAVDYICARCEMPNDEATLRQRAPMFYQPFNANIKEKPSNV
jgi:hypothetical protein